MEFNFNNASAGTSAVFLSFHMLLNVVFVFCRHLNKLQIRLPRKPVASAPTKRYGDHICQADQDETLCPSDCVNTEFFTYDDIVGVKGSNDTLDKVCT